MLALVPTGSTADSTNIGSKIFRKKKKFKYFPGGPVAKNPPCNAQDTGSIPGPGRFHSN